MGLGQRSRSVTALVAVAAAVVLHAPAHHALATTVTTAAAATASPHYWTTYRRAAAPLREYTSQATNPGGGVVLFGGQTLSQTPTVLAETWVWNTNTWTLKNPAGAPSARVQGQAAHHGDRVVLFGGRGSPAGTAGPAALGDTWVWDGTTWTERHPAVSPPATYGGSLVNDGAGNLVLYGGIVNGAPSFQTWTWNGTTWRLASSAGPSLVTSRAATEATGAPGRVLLLGRPFGATYTETWVWDGAAWTQLQPAHDPGLQRAMALDGDGRNVLLGDYATWTWNGTDWTAVPLAESPQFQATAVADGAGRVVAGTPGWDTSVWQVVNATVVASGIGPQATPIGRPFAQPLRVSTRDRQGTRIAGVPVTFTLPATGPSATFPGGATSASAVTGPDGYFDTPVLTANSVVGSYQATASSPGAQSASIDLRNTPTPVSVVAAVGTNHALYVRRSTAAGFTNLGGYLIDAPAVARTADGTVYYIGSGRNSRLYIRTDRLPWKPLTAAGAICRQPGAVGGNGWLGVGCRGSNNHLLGMAVSVSNGGLPSFQQIPSDLGGIITSGPSVTMDPGLIYQATAPAAAGAANVWEYRSFGSTWRPVPHVSCTSQPSASRPFDPRLTFRACRASTGSLGFWTGDSGPVNDVGGAIVGTPGVAGHVTNSSATVYARGTNGQVYLTTVQAWNDGSTFTSEPWRSLGGKVLYGVGAVAIAG